MNYLLSAQTLLDLCAEAPNAAQAWARRIPADTLRVSVVSWAHAAAEVAAIDDASVRQRYEADFSAFIGSLIADAGPAGLMGFERRHANVWQVLLFDERLAGVAQQDRQVYATAMSEGLTVVEDRHALTDVLRDEVGVDILVPGE